MAFIIKKKVYGKDYYYLRKSIRVGKKVVSKCLGYLGKNKKEAEKKAKEILENIENNKKTVEILKTNMTSTNISVEDMATFCKRKGFVYQSGEIYGGLAGFWDFGHLGVEMKNNLKQNWWNFFVRQREDIVGIDGSIITNPKVWQASGHEANFSDVLVVCKRCKKVDKVDKHEIGKVKCASCGGEIDWNNVREIKQMFRTDVGIDSFAYLRPETAQLIFADFKLVQENARMKLPFGIAQVGKSFRNEIAPRDFLFRLREFEQMEIEYFVDPNEKFPYEIGNTEILIFSEEMQKQNKEPVKMSFKEAFEKKIISTNWHAYWLEQEFSWFINLGANPEKFRIRQHVSDEKSHYALDTWDLEYKFPFGWKELQGIANRTDFDLKQHQEHSKVKMEMENNEGKKIIPHVVCEPSQGVERAFLVFMFDAYKEDKERNNIILQLDPKLAPVKVAIFPIVKKPEFEKIAREIYDSLKKEWNVLYDRSGSIGRRYARNDEIGTPYCITIDGNSLTNNDVTLRNRDDAKQIRIKIPELKDTIRKLIEKEISFEKIVK
jgi:glycyl-tRNA synthetase